MLHVASLITKVSFEVLSFFRKVIYFVFVSTAICLCPDGFTGQPSVECVPFECKISQDCDNDKKCVDGSCKNPCFERNVCGKNAMCRAEQHEASCVCLPNFAGDARVQCVESRILTCQPNSCGTNAMCRIDNDGVTSCYCPPLYPHGDAKVECMFIANDFKFLFFYVLFSEISTKI